MEPITFITGNPNKAAQVTKWVGVPIEHYKLDLDELQSLDLHEIIEHKVKQAYGILQKPVLVEDASLTFMAMGRLPGTFIKWFIEEIGVDGLARLAASLDHQKAVGRVSYALYDGQTLHTFEGEMHGTIAPEPRGNGGFGFDAIFMNEGFTCTRSEMSEEDYAATSYRTAGLKKLKDFLTKQ